MKTTQYIFGCRSYRCVIVIRRYYRAMSFRITEEYVQGALELAKAGYPWRPAPGDWMLDLDDHSIGMLTTPVKRPEMIRRLNIHLPTQVQTEEMLGAHGVELRDKDGPEFVHGDSVIARFSRQEFSDDEALCCLKALTAWHKSVSA